jgi:hypothetical protein
MGPLDEEHLDRAVRASSLFGRHAQAVDRESENERHTAARAEEEAAAPAGPKSRRDPAEAKADREPAEEPSVIEQVVTSGVFKSLARSVGARIGREITRSPFGTARRRR